MVRHLDLDRDRVGTVIGGAVIDGHGWRAAVILGIGFFALAAVLTLVRRSTLAPPFPRPFSGT